MPQQSIKYTNPLDDGRRKILKSQYPEIKQLYSELKSYQKTADHYGVSKRTIIFIVRPETYEKLKHNNKLNEHWKKYYNKEKRKLYQRNFRAKKRKLKLLTGLI